MSILISPQDLNERINHGAKTTILASLWMPHEGGGFQLFQSEHIPTALFCDTAAALASTPSSSVGRNPLPDPDKLQRWFNHWGLHDDREIIVYDQGKGLFSARAWWILTWAGVKGVRILDGGLAAWERAGYQIVGGPGNLGRGQAQEVVAGQLPVATIDEVKNFDGVLIDTREANRYAGRKERLDLKAGHIPGAVSVPTREILNPDNTFRPAEEIRATFEKVGVTDPNNVIVYSGSGVHSAQAIAAMHYAGLPGAALYLGGWSQWCADRNNPVERSD